MATIDDFLSKADTAERLQMVRDPALEADLRAYLGDQAFAEYVRLFVNAGTGGHLSRLHSPNLVFVPGVMGSLLLSRTRGGVWWIDARSARHIDDLCLSPDGATDRDANDDVVPCTTDPLYEPFLTALLEREDFGHVVFPYDWRKSMRCSTGAFRDRVRECHKNNGGPVHVVAHSMGGLLVRAALMEHGAELWPLIDRIVFIGTPHYGSASIAGYLKNHLWGFDVLALVGTLLTRASFRSLWGVIGMLPAPTGVYPGTRAGDRAPLAGAGWGTHPCANFNMYRAEEWDLGLSSVEEGRLQVVLEGAAALHRDMSDAHRALTSAQRARMLMIAGVGYKTLFRLDYPTGLLKSWQSITKVVDRVPGDVHREGDGRVPLASAMLEGVTIRYVRGVHGGLTNIPAAYKEALRWLNGESLELPDTQAQALSRHLAADGTSAAPNLDGSARAGTFTDDPGYLDFEGPDEATLSNYRTQLEAGTLPAFNSARIF